MSSMRKVRKNFRAEVHRLISSGDGNIETLTRSAGQHFGYEVGYEALIKSFLQTEVSNAVKVLRDLGHIETIGKKWKPVEELQPNDVETIAVRRLKRLRGELKAGISLAHQHGRTEEAVAESQMLGIVDSCLRSPEPSAEPSVAP